MLFLTNDRQVLEAAMPGLDEKLASCDPGSLETPSGQGVALFQAAGRRQVACPDQLRRVRRVCRAGRRGAAGGRRTVRVAGGGHHHAPLLDGQPCRARQERHAAWNGFSSRRSPLRIVCWRRVSPKASPAPVS